MDRIAFLPAENLTGDASFDWISSALPVMGASQIAGVGNLLPLRSGSSVEATGSAANHLVHSYFDQRGGKLHFEFSIEDAATHKMQTVAVDGDPITAAKAMAAAITPAAHSFSSAKLPAIEAWARRDFARAVELDPSFGTAWRDLIQSQMKQPEVAAPLAARALKEPSLQSPLDRAEIELLDARLRHDEKSEVAATDQLVKLQPNDVELLRSLAEQETAARRFDRSVRFYRAVLELTPEDTAQYNFLGYAQFYAGDLAGARKSFETYGKTPGQEANALDSEGEVLFMAGQFKPAEDYFRRAHKAEPGLLDGSDLMKAAYARWLGGDLPGADREFQEYLQYRGQHSDQTVIWRQSVWEYATGRSASAIARLQGIQGPMAQIAASQLTVWANAARAQQDLATLESGYRTTPPGSDGLIRTMYARGLLQAGKKDEAAKLAVQWPLPESGDPLLQSLLYPMYLELRKELGK